jgi:hypothetical protein
MLKLKTSRTGTPEEKDVPRATPQEETEKGGKTRTVTQFPVLSKVGEGVTEGRVQGRRKWRGCR